MENEHSERIHAFLFVKRYTALSLSGLIYLLWHSCMPLPLQLPPKTEIPQRGIFLTMPPFSRLIFVPSPYSTKYNECNYRMRVCHPDSIQLINATTPHSLSACLSSV